MTSVTVPLTQGAVAYIDEEDLPLVAGHSWSLARRDHTCYAQTGVVVGGRPQIVLMHRLLLDAPSTLQVDHIDRDGLNNRRRNLRLATRSQNQVNTGPRARNSTGFKGVTWDARRNRYVAHMTYQGRQYHLGRFSDPAEAARAYDAKARELHGEYARTNF